MNNFSGLVQQECYLIMNCELSTRLNGTIQLESDSHYMHSLNEFTLKNNIPNRLTDKNVIIESR